MIELKENFSVTMIIEDVVLPNTFTITVNLIPNSQYNKLYNKAMERIQYYITEILDNSIFVGCGINSSNLNDWWYYSIATNSCVQTPNLPGNNRHHPFYFSFLFEFLNHELIP